MEATWTQEDAHNAARLTGPIAIRKGARSAAEATIRRHVPSTVHTTTLINASSAVQRTIHCPALLTAHIVTPTTVKCVVIIWMGALVCQA